MMKFIVMLAVLMSANVQAGCVDRVVKDCAMCDWRVATVCDNSLGAIPVAPAYIPPPPLPPMQPMQPMPNHNMDAFYRGAATFNQGLNTYLNSPH